MFDNLNRKLHIHLGLFFLFFIWLFSLSGLILNHDRWKFASFWNEREEAMVDFKLPLASLKQPDVKDEVLKSLKLKGEIQEVKHSPEKLSFRLVSPGTVKDIQLDLTTGEGAVKALQFNFWGKFRTLHTFNGIDKGNPSQAPNWFVTSTWRLTMDIFSIGLIVICLSSWIMWYKIRKDYKLGMLALITGIAVAVYFLAL